MCVRRFEVHAGLDDFNGGIMRIYHRVDQGVQKFSDSAFNCKCNVDSRYECV